MVKKTPICAGCKILKDESEFYSCKSRLGITSYCKQCNRERSKGYYEKNKDKCKANHRLWVQRNQERVRLHKIKAAYGLSVEEYEAMPKSCEVCGATRGLCVDHSHRTGVVRGTLCGNCNKGIGFLADNPTLLWRAGDYLMGIK